MLAEKTIRSLIQDVLAKALPKTRISDVEVRDYADSTGEQALEIMIVLSKGKSVDLNGAELAKILENIHDALLERGDLRFPYVRYLTAAEAKQAAD